MLLPYYAATLAKPCIFMKNIIWKNMQGHEFNKAVIRNCIGKIAGQMLAYIKEVVMLSIVERTEVAAD